MRIASSKELKNESALRSRPQSSVSIRSLCPAQTSDERFTERVFNVIDLNRDSTERTGEPAADDLLRDRNEPWANYDSPAIRRCVRNDATAEIVYQLGQLQRAMPEDAPDQEHLDKMHRALTDAATALQDALKPYAAPTT